MLEIYADCSSFHSAVATGFLDQTRADGGEYKHTRFSLSYATSAPGPGKLFLAM